MCPDCRSHEILRRKRSGLFLMMKSVIGWWPYHCERCGKDFFLRKRYKSRKKSTEEDPDSIRMEA